MKSARVIQFLRFCLLPALLWAGASFVSAQEPAGAAPPVEILPPAPPASDPGIPPAGRPEMRSGVVRPISVTPGIGFTINVPAGETYDGDAIAMFADAKIDGLVPGDLVVINGSATVNGTVNGDVVVILGDLHLGPQAVVRGEGVIIGGSFDSKEGARVRGEVIHIPLGASFRLPSPESLIKPPGSRGLWIWAALSTIGYVLLGVAFPLGVRRIGETLIHRPVASFFTAVLALLAIPVVFALLCVSVVGIPIALVVLPLALVVCLFLGKAAILALIGRGVSGDRLPPSLAILSGALLMSLFYFVPVLALSIGCVISLFGFGAVLATASASRAVAPKPVVPVPSGPPTQHQAPPAFTPFPPPAEPSSGAVGMISVEPPASAEPVRQAQGLQPTAGRSVRPLDFPPPISVEMDFLPRAGFWRRVGALLLDSVVVGMVMFPLIAMSEGRLFFLVVPVLAIYAIVMWKLRGTTVGGIICNFRIARFDNRPVDWGTATVRALGCFLSAAVAFLGFIWIAVDADKQAWHDKIAGTIVVIPRGRSALI